MSDENVVLTGTGVTPVEFLEAVYMNPDLPLTVRIKAAVEALPYVHPKLAMVATANANGGDFGTMLERAIEASKAARQSPKIIEARTQPTNGHHSSPNDVSSNAMKKNFPTLRRRA
jgi:hypothetical protein